MTRCEKCKGRRGRYLSGAPGMWLPCDHCNGTGVRPVATQQSSDPKSGEGNDERSREGRRRVDPPCKKWYRRRYAKMPKGKG
jgi:hypothetical protein